MNNPDGGNMDLDLCLSGPSPEENPLFSSPSSSCVDPSLYKKEGGIPFTVSGSSIFISVLISNVAGAGDIAAVKVKGSRTGWLPMGRNWGQNWHINADLKKKPLSFEVTSSNGVTVTSYNVAPKNWNHGQTFEGQQFDS